MKDFVRLPSYLFQRFAFSTVDMVKQGNSVLLLFRDDKGDVFQTLIISQ